MYFNEYIRVFIYILHKTHKIKYYDTLGSTTFLNLL